MKHSLKGQEVSYLCGQIGAGTGSVCPRLKTKACPVPCPNTRQALLFCFCPRLLDYPGAEVIRYTEWSAAESLARFGPPGFGLGTPSPGSAPGPGLGSGSGSGSGWEQGPCRAGGGAGLLFVSALTVLITSFAPANNRCITVCITLHNLHGTVRIQGGK